MRRQRGVVLALTVVAALALGVGQILPARASAPFVSGDAIAQAGVIGVAPFTGGLSYTLAVGDSTANYEDTEAKASSNELDLGIYGVIATEVAICGQAALLKPSELPQGLELDSTGGKASKADSTSGGPAAGDSQSVAVDPTPAARATAGAAGLSIPGVIELGGGQSAASARVVGGNQRAADAGSSVADISLLGGVVHIGALAWSASHRSGTAAASKAAFTVGSVTVAGVPLPVADSAQLAGTIDTVNRLLTPVGLQVHLPAVTTSDTAASVAPLVIELGQSVISSPLVSPLLAALQPLRDALNGTTASGTDCSKLPVLLGSLLGPAQTVADIALAAFSPAGGLEVDLGGASAGTDARKFTSPFGTVAPPPVPPAIPAVSAGPPGSLVTSVTTPAVAPSASIAAPPSQLARVVRCVTTSKAASPGCWRGAADTAGGITLLVAGALFAADWRRSHHRVEEQP